MNYRAAVVLIVSTSIMAGAAVAQDEAAAKVRARGGVAIQLDLSAGGDEINSSRNDPPHTAQAILGEGVTVSLGGFYRPSESKPWELQAFIGYKRGWIVPVRGGGHEADVSRWVFQLLANYRHKDKWHFGGGLVFHGNPKYEDTAPGVADVNFDNAVGAAIEGGWSWLGVQCTYIEYRAPGTGTLDASNCGVRFTWRFRKWGPLR
ncbi:MAG TPA: hypothetical protein VFS58_16430 [Steroidobacteraceae bacterium]|nr:hypothetical protein [Steroidobacteraceae bacterium]